MFEMLIFIAFGIVMLLLIAFFYFRDQSLFAKLEAYERAIDELNSRVYELEHKRPKQENNLQNYKEIFSKMQENLDNKLNELGEPLLRTIRAIKSMEERLDRLENRVDQKIQELQQSTKTQQNITNSTRGEDKVLTLYKEGKSIEEIAKLTRLGIGEVELMIKLANLRK
jgi:Skp family chaperone for outer membrane proteins